MGTIPEHLLCAGIYCLLARAALLSHLAQHPVCSRHSSHSLAPYGTLVPIQDLVGVGSHVSGSPV
jgi:hypothetical protein